MPRTVGSVQIRGADGEIRACSVSDLVDVGVSDLRPIRNSSIYKGQRNAPGFWWSQTDGDLVPYESINERQVVMTLDWEPTVTAIAAQPFRVRLGPRSIHVPDFVVARDGGSRSLVDVTTRIRLERDTSLQRIFADTAAICSDLGWTYVVVQDTDFDQQFLFNLRYLATFRRKRFVSSDLCHAVVDAYRGPSAFGDLVDAGDRRQAWWPAALHLIWHSQLTVDLWSPITVDSIVGRTFAEVLRDETRSLAELIPTMRAWSVGEHVVRSKGAPE